MVVARSSQPVSAEVRLRELGIELPAAPTPFGNYVEVLRSGNLLFLTGMLPVVDHKPKYLGRLGKELDADAGVDAARTAALSALSAIKGHLGSLDKMRRVIRLGVFMATYGDFFDQPKVADGASDLFVSVLGTRGISTRLVIGVASLPLGMPIELEVVAEVGK
ncbi:MAG TPA: RidA family protein [Terracidiphilus sp.]|nr:RidA family protein [Terracidiphilus sp.]